MICWLERQFAQDHATLTQRPLYNDDEVIADILRHYNADQPITAEDVTIAYTYPLKYVEEVLLEKIKVAENTNRDQDNLSGVVFGEPIPEQSQGQVEFHDNIH